MKKLPLLLSGTLLYITSRVYAQSASDSSIIQKSEYIIQHLDKANIPTGVLYDTFCL